MPGGTKEKNMSDYNRTTRACPVSQLRPELRQALRDYFQEQQLGDPDAETILCCETTSTRKSTDGLVAWLNHYPETTIYTALLLTAEWLIWVRHGDKSGTHLTAASLNTISAQEYASLLTRDTGLEVRGYIVGSKSPMRGYIGLGPEPAAQQFCTAVKEAISKANPPSPSKFPKWMGG
jgi:hypothetical protein